MRKAILAVSASLLLPAFLAAQEEGQGAELQLTRAVMARGVEGREPTGEAETFPRDVGQVVCFTQLQAGADTVVYHVWRHGTTLHAKVQLSVGAGSWRTWSRKRIHPSWTGDWTVDIEDEKGVVLKSLAFTIGGTDGAQNAPD
jgi:hypothetical protein